jgi:hypothetical protein
VTVPFEVVSVKRDGKAESWNVGPLANGVRVQIGNPGVLLPHGRHVYEISYRTRYQLGFFDDHDELYWNVNGNGWTFAMDSVSADVGCRARSAAQLQAEAYTGAFGAKGGADPARCATVAPNIAPRRRWRRARADDRVLLPQGVIPAGWWQPLRSFARQPGGSGRAGMLLLLAFFPALVGGGRDPRKAGVSALRAPTAGPAAHAYLDKMDATSLLRCGAAGLGQRGSSGSGDGRLPSSAPARRSNAAGRRSSCGFGPDRRA